MIRVYIFGDHKRESLSSRIMTSDRVELAASKDGYFIHTAVDHGEIYLTWVEVETEAQAVLFKLQYL